MRVPPPVSATLVGFGRFAPAREASQSIARAELPPNSGPSAKGRRADTHRSLPELPAAANTAIAAASSTIEKVKLDRSTKADHEESRN